MPQYLSDNHMLYVYEANAKSLMDPFVHRHQYRLSLNNASVCSRDIFLLILVNSALEHKKEREVIRETWGSVKEYSGAQIRTVFLVGECTQPKTKSTWQLNERLKAESDIHGDIVKGNFIDKYANLTYKTVMGLYWVNIYCSRSSFVMKTDDDVSINLYKLVDFLQEISQTPSILSHFYFGRCEQDFPVRSRSSKWYISFSDYEYKLYPPYCRGPGYVFSNEDASHIYSATSKVPFIWMEDVYIGFCAEFAKIKPINNFLGYYFLQPIYNYLNFQSWSATDAPWEYTILKVNDAAADKTEKRDTWAYIKSHRSYHSLHNYTSVVTCVIMLLVCSLICMLAMFIKFHRRKCHLLLSSLEN